MAVETDAERAEYLADWGVTVQKLDQGSPTPTFTAIFDAAYTLIDSFESAGVNSSRPTLTARTSDVSDLAEGDSLMVDGTAYTFIRSEDDGTGISLVVLEE